MELVLRAPARCGGGLLMRVEVRIEFLFASDERLICGADIVGVEAEILDYVLMLKCRGKDL